MTRLTGLITHNWPLKVAAVALATVLYASLALSQNARTWPGRVPIEAVDQPAGAFLLEGLGDVTSIRYYAPADVAARISSSDFQAIADLSSVTPSQGGAPVSVPVEVIALDPRIKVLDYQPDRVAVRVLVTGEEDPPRGRERRDDRIKAHRRRPSSPRRSRRPGAGSRAAPTSPAGAGRRGRART